MVKVIITGAAGRMGARLVALTKESAALTLAGAVERKGHGSIGEDAGETAGCGPTGVRITEDLSSLLPQAEVLVDFSAPEASLEHVRLAAQHRRAVVLGTTGFTTENMSELRAFARHIPCVVSPNMS
ncbi:MAG: 4-hydroxy-tetrahydrodipicolinate reductase, partial [Acidimicrobiia bacterium]